MMVKEVEGLEWALYPKTIYYTRKSDNVKLATTGVTIQVTKKQGMDPNIPSAHFLGSTSFPSDYPVTWVTRSRQRSFISKILF
jgi:hypothetical protein